MKGGHFYWGDIGDRDIEYVYLRDINDKYRRSQKHKMTTFVYPLAEQSIRVSNLSRHGKYKTPGHISD
ncbi:hypothetical protein LCGC14_2269610, partial [marine sediment metagenome]